MIEQDVDAARDVVRALRAANPDLVIGIGGDRSGSVAGPELVRLPDGVLQAVEVMARALG